MSLEEFFRAYPAVLRLVSNDILLLTADIHSDNEGSTQLSNGHR